MRRMPKQSDDLSRKDEPSQETEKGLKIPIPDRREFNRFVEGISKEDVSGEAKDNDSDR